MECKNDFEVEDCGTDIPPSLKFCGFCGGNVVTYNDYNTQTCPKCLILITSRQRFCCGCGWQIEPSIFLQKKIFCPGFTPENKICGAELLSGTKFCNECETVQNISTEAPGLASEVQVDDLMKDILPSRPQNENSDSSLSSRPGSPDTWKPLDVLTTKPDSNCPENEIHASRGSQLPIGSIGEHIHEETKEKADSKYLQLIKIDRRESSNEDNPNINGDFEFEASFSPVIDFMNNNVTEQISNQEPMKTEQTIEGGCSSILFIENSQRLCFENTSTITLDVTKSDVILPDAFKQPRKNEAQLYCVPSELEQETSLTQQIEKSCGNPQGKIQLYNMVTGSKQAFQMKSRVQELTKKLESTNEIENSGKNQEEYNGCPKLRSEFSYSSKSVLGLDEDGPISNTKDADPIKNQRPGGKVSKDKLSGTTNKCQQKKKKKKRKMSEQIKSTETDPVTDNKDTTATLTTMEKAITQNDDGCKQTDEGRKQNSDMSNGKKQQDETNPYNRKGITQGNLLNQNLNINSKQTDKNTGNWGSTQENRGTANKSNESKKTEFVEVNFHIIVSPTLLYNAQKGDVYVAFQSSALGGWKSKEHKMNLKRFLVDDHLEYEGLVKIPKEILMTHLYYCYYVVNDGNEVIEEHIYCPSSEAKHRSLSMEPSKSRGKIECNCIIYKACCN